jgi:alpha-ketoglutarate-dependent taurine dioxygenase
LLLQPFDDVTIVWPWQTHDLMILDNLQISHWRNPFIGERETEVAMLD